MRKKSNPAADGFDATREQIHRQMLSTVSHDLKTPLATMIGSLEIYNRMEAKLTPEKRKMLIDSALHEAYRLDSFITNILDMAKFEGGMVTIRSATTDLKQLLEDCLLRLGPQRERGEIILNPIGELKVNTDAMLLGRAINLLIDNGLKHAGPQAKISVEYGHIDGNMVIRVRDQGPGIPDHMHEHIFSKYTRMNKADQQNAGTGLGLAICRQIMTNLGGTVQVANHPDGGAVFTLTIPAQA
jgi:K+-sensing histidine kinase KdpD